MNTRDYRNAMDLLNPAPDLEGRIKGQLTQPHKRQPHPRRLAGKVLVAVTAIACTFMAAMAVSPQLRAAVLTFFHLEEAEQVPGPVGEVPEEPEMTQTTIDDLVEAQYIRLPNAGSGYSYGIGTLFQAERADDGSLLDFHYWAAEGDQLVPLETRTTEFSTTWDGVTYTDTVYWCEYEGAISCHCDGTSGYASDYNYNVTSIPGSTDSVILRLSQGSQMDYRQYPVLLNLETGEITDLLSGTGWEKSAPLTDVQWTNDLSAALLYSDHTGWFYCDRAAKTTTALDEFTGPEVFSAWFGQDGALILLTRSGPDGDCYDVWTWQPEDGQPKRTFSHLPVYQSRAENPYGFQFFFGGGQGIYVAEDGTVSVLDLVTGATTIVEDFSLSQQENATLIANASGTKVLFASYDGQADGLGISSLGVMDLERGVFTLLDRENYDALQEGSLSWFDEDRVAITAHGKRDYNETYLYLYRF